MTSWIDTLKKKAKGFNLSISNRDLPNTALNTTKLSLRILKETLDGIPVPGLKGAIGSLLVVMDNVDRVKQNAKDFADLSEYLDAFSDMLSQFKNNNNDGRDFPAPLLKPIDFLAEAITRISKENAEVISHKLWRRVVDNSDDAQTFVRNLRKVSQSLQKFQTQATLALTVAVEQNIETAQQYILDKLPVAEYAFYNSSEREFASKCLDDTRVAVRAEIEHWIFNRDAPPVFWLNGLAGTGKSTIAQSTAEFCAEKKFLSASFFFSHQQVVRRPTDIFFTTLARQLSAFDPRLNSYHVDALKRSDPPPR